LNAVAAGGGAERARDQVDPDVAEVEDAHHDRADRDKPG